MGFIALTGTGVFWFLGDDSDPDVSVEIYESKPAHSFKDDISSVIELLRNKRMRMLIP